MREVVMAMCERSGCAYVITFCEGSPPPFLSFFGFCLIMVFFLTCVSLKRHGDTAHKLGCV